MGKTKIEWTRGDDGALGETWNPIRGCSRVSEGCRHCYAEAVAGRFCGPGQPYEGLAGRTPAGARWTGEVRLVTEHLADPLRWRRPRRVFVNSMSDLFHERLADDEIAAVFGVMAAAPQHTFQVLTKRPERMRRWFEWVSPNEESVLHVHALEGLARAGSGAVEANCLFDRSRGYPEAGSWRWPLPNVWLGVSLEDQRTADERIPLLLRTPAAVRFVSAEPLLEAVDLSPYLGQIGIQHPLKPAGVAIASVPGVTWVIVGGESGPGARPFDIPWARSLVGQCRAAGVACFIKQLGSFPIAHSDDDLTTDQWVDVDATDLGNPNHYPLQVRRRDRKGADPGEWPEELRVREFPPRRGR